MKKVIIVVIILILFIPTCMFIYYKSNLSAVDKNNTESVVITIPSGSTSKDISEILYDNNLIKSADVFMFYVKLNNITNMQAASYDFNKSMNVEEIIDTLVNAKNTVVDSFMITFKEGINMRSIATIISENTNNTYEDVLSLVEDREYIKTLMEDYTFLPEEILDENIYYPLEGYLFPDTYMVPSRDVDIDFIFRAMLNQTKKIITEHQSEIDSSEYSLHEILTLASLVELEGVSSVDRKNVASVFYNRLEDNWSLGSDVTTYYAIKVDMSSDRDLYQSELDLDNPYNTRGPNMEGKLPIGPIASSSLESILAAMSPSDTDYYYFVADSNRKVYFSETYSKFQSDINTIKNEGLWIF